VLVKIAPEFAKHMRKDGTLVVRVCKGLYGSVQSARQWYNLLSQDLIRLGFVINRADICAFNRHEGDDTQTTLVVHEDDQPRVSNTSTHF
jgi:hypothetical protein